MNYYGKTILITGASSGIGESFAEKFASLGAKLVLVARREDVLNALASKFKEKHGTETQVIGLDLAAPGAAAKLYEQVPAIDGLVNNAGFGTYGPLYEQDADKVNQEVQLNCGALVDLTRTYLPGMVERKEGFVINLASVASFQPSPYLAVYSATKAFVLSFTQSIWGELQGTGVTALAVCPGPTKTNFFDAAGGHDFSVGKMRTPAHVVETALKGLTKNKHTAVDGFGNKLLAFFGRVSPRTLTINVVGKMVKE
ncbi:SDR family NAD(P)-dependent oxidoreductase [Psychromicrobium sp. YIM B11713]|uniref:SDR family NAD(P)-dependent oxidoreductase n=1 Tax=Psychromicrobium sp. YIM B11713 TaxID=3145233 RepID=UPI00374E3644